ncbi:MAG: hypothetical protein U5K69_16120 [Balneolaceae bacterium]|nr:hypothetical protein [Balneolaceae bacterium]
MKINSSLHYRLSDQVEASYSLNYGYGTSVYTGAQRYSLKNFNITQHKLQLEGSNFLLKGYGTFGRIRETPTSPTLWGSL